jgi:hypothetical protein
MQELEAEDDLLSKVPVRYVHCHTPDLQVVLIMKSMLGKQKPQGETHKGVC